SIAGGDAQAPGHGQLPPDRAATQFQIPVPTHAGGAEEAATMVQGPTAVPEESTCIMEATAVALAEESESATLAMPPPLEVEAGEEKTLIEGRQTVRDNPAAGTIPADGLTRVGSILGTPTYMSPEQCRGEALDARSDIYSLAVIAYQMVAGKPPFSGGMQDMIRQHIDAAPPKLKRDGTRIPKIMRNAI